MGCATVYKSRVFVKDPMNTLSSPKEKVLWCPKITKQVKSYNESRFLNRLGEFESNLNVIIESPSDFEISSYLN